MNIRSIGITYFLISSSSRQTIFLQVTGFQTFALLIGQATKAPQARLATQAPQATQATQAALAAQATQATQATQAAQATQATQATQLFFLISSEISRIARAELNSSSQPLPYRVRVIL